jgi:hypothetical protein
MLIAHLWACSVQLNIFISSGTWQITFLNKAWARKLKEIKPLLATLREERLRKKKRIEPFVAVLPYRSI